MGRPSNRETNYYATSLGVCAAGRRLGAINFSKEEITLSSPRAKRYSTHSSWMIVIASERPLPTNSRPHTKNSPTLRTLIKASRSSLVSKMCTGAAATGLVSPNESRYLANRSMCFGTGPNASLGNPDNGRAPIQKNLRYHSRQPNLRARVLWDEVGGNGIWIAPPPTNVPRSGVPSSFAASTRDRILMLR